MGREAEEKVGQGFHGIKVNVRNSIKGNISAFSGGITQIDVKDNTGAFKTIWKNGASITPTPTIADGTNWELRVFFSVGSTVALWAASLTVVAPEAPAGYSKLSKNVRYMTSGNYTDSADFNMGAMPAANVNLRVKLWTTDYYTVDPPADAAPTAW